MSRLGAVWAEIRDSLWFVPAVLTALAVLLAFTTIWVDQQNVLQRDGLWFLFAVGYEGARGVLSTIAGSLITITGVVFSITIVALQLASSQFTPRVLRSFMQDRLNQLVLGVFIGTFTYALLVLRAVRSPMDEQDAFAPALSVTVALLLALVSVGFLIFFINHIAQSIRAEVILGRVTDDALRTIDDLFPEQLGESAGNVTLPDPELPGGRTLAIGATTAGYLQAVDEDGVLELTHEHDLVLEMCCRIGDFVLEGDVLARAWPAERAREVATDIEKLFRLGAERTRYQDVERGIIELIDIGIRALSPGVNDPTTALACIDRLTQVLATLGTRRFPDAIRADADGRPRFIAKRPTYEDVVRLGFAELRHHGASTPAVALRLMHAIGRVAARVPPIRRAPLLEQMQHLIEAVRGQIDHSADLMHFDRAIEQTRANFAS